MSVYIEVDNKGKLTYAHYLPFDETHGLHRTEKELLELGFLVDSVPEAEERVGKIADTYYSPENGFWHEYVNMPAGPATTSDIRSLNAKLDYFMMMQEVI